MAVSFHEPGHEDLVGEAIVELVGAPADEILESAVPRMWPSRTATCVAAGRRVHGDDSCVRSRWSWSWRVSYASRPMVTVSRARPLVFCENTGSVTARFPISEPIAMLPLTGYADRLSVRPGETIRFHLANATACAGRREPGEGRVRRRATRPVPASSQSPWRALRSRARPRARSGLRRARTPASRTAGAASARRASRSPVSSIPRGSQGNARRSLRAPAPRRRAGSTSPSTGRVDSAPPSVTGASMPEVATVPAPLVERAWHAVWLVVDAAAGEVAVGWAALSPSFGQARTLNVARASLPAGAVPARRRSAAARRLEPCAARPSLQRQARSAGGV